MDEQMSKYKSGCIRLGVTRTNLKENTSSNFHLFEFRTFLIAFQRFKVQRAIYSRNVIAKVQLDFFKGHYEQLLQKLSGQNGS